VYVNGVLDGVSTRTSSPLAIKTPARLWLGGWHDGYDFVGDLDEVRISRVTRSADWVRLEYENQKPLQTLVGPVVQPGTEFAVRPAEATVFEGKSVEFTALAGGARKVYWVLERGGREIVVATDRFRFVFDAGRVTQDAPAVLRVRAVYPNEVRNRDIPITVREQVPEPVFTLTAPESWDGRRTIEVVPVIANGAAMEARGAGALNVGWSVSGIASVRRVAAGKLVLERAQNSGELTVTATVDNGGPPVSRSVTIPVREPDHDAWVPREPSGGRDARGRSILRAR
jgi:hypothetical protein